MKKTVDKEVLNRMVRLQAFALFKRDGMDAVRETYPECASFVQENRLFSYREVMTKLSLAR